MIILCIIFTIETIHIPQRGFSAIIAGAAIFLIQQCFHVNNYILQLISYQGRYKIDSNILKCDAFVLCV